MVSLRTVYTRLWQQTGDVSSFFWKLATVRVLRPLQSHDAQYRLTLLLGVTTQ